MAQRLGQGAPGKPGHPGTSGRHSERGRDGRGPLIPAAPADLRATLGALDRKLYVVPSLGLVVTRLGDSTVSPDLPADARSTFDRDFWQKLMAAAPKSVE